MSITEGDRTVTVALADCLEKSGCILKGKTEVSTAESNGYSQMLAVKSGTKVVVTYINNGWSSAIICYDSAGLYSKTIAGTYGTYEYSLDESTYYIRVNGDINAQTITYVPRN